MMDLRITEKSYFTDDNSWLATGHGTQETRTVTLDGDLMAAVFTDGWVPSGVVLGLVSATGRYGPYDDTAADGRETAAGHLYTGCKVAAGATFGAALYWHGAVVESRLPASHGLDAAAKTDVAGFIRYF